MASVMTSSVVDDGLESRFGISSVMASVMTSSVVDDGNGQVANVINGLNVNMNKVNKCRKLNAIFKVKPVLCNSPPIVSNS
jgi:hypothetical protein